MSYYNFFTAPGKFYKGNLHCHSNLSDGKLTPQILVDYYKKAGYSFLALSDHRIFYMHDNFCDENFITLPSTELNSTVSEISEFAQKTHHIQVIMDPEIYSSAKSPLTDGQRFDPPEFNGVETAEEMGKNALESGAFCIYNHPGWSKTYFEDYGLLEDYIGIEIYNHASYLENNVGHALSHWDYLLENGAKIYGIASDDNHNGYYKTNLDDSHGGFICVKSEELTRESIVRAIKSGNFYASNGPEINNIKLNDNVISVECSGVKRINFVCGGKMAAGTTAHSKDNADSLTHAEFTIPKNVKYVRIECIQNDHKTAWSNPVYLD